MPTRAPTQLRLTRRLSSHAPIETADTTRPHSSTWPGAPGSLNQPWAKASAVALVG